VIQEVIAYMSTPAAAWAKDIGFLSEAISIESRWNAHADAYRSHQRNCHEAILNAAENVAHKNRVILLGAGIIYDVPLADLIGIFNEVVLVDCVFTKTTRRLVDEYPTVRILEYDLSGVCKRLDKKITDDPLPIPESLLPGEVYEADLVVSLNLLSQLPLLPEKFARKHKLRGDVSAWGEEIEMAHLNAIRNLDVEVLMISDYAYLSFTTGNNTVEEPTLYNISGDPDSQWLWEIHPKGNDRKEHRAALRVGTWSFRK